MAGRQKEVSESLGDDCLHDLNTTKYASSVNSIGHAYTLGYSHKPKRYMKDETNIYIF